MLIRRHGGTYRHLKTLLRFKLLHHDANKYDGYRLTYMGCADTCSLGNALSSEMTYPSVGRQDPRQGSPGCSSCLQVRLPGDPHAAGTGAHLCSRPPHRRREGIRRLRGRVQCAAAMHWDVSVRRVDFGKVKAAAAAAPQRAGVAVELCMAMAAVCSSWRGTRLFRFSYLEAVPCRGFCRCGMRRGRSWR